MNTDNQYNPIELSKEYLKKSTLDNQVSIEQGFNVELYEVSNNLAFIKNFGNIAVFKNDTTGLLIDTGMGVSSMQVIEKLKEWGISNIEYINSTLLLSQGKSWIEERNFENFQDVFSCQNHNHIIGEFLFLISNLYSSQDDFERSNFYLYLSNFSVISLIASSLLFSISFRIFSTIDRVL